MERIQVKRTFQVGERMVTIHAVEQIGVEDCYTMLMKAVMHRYVTAEDVVPAISREVKDSILKQSLVI